MGYPLIILSGYFVVGSALGAAWVWREALIKPRPALIFSFLHILLGWPFYGMIAVGLVVLALLIDPHRSRTLLEPGRNGAHRDRAPASVPHTIRRERQRR